MPEPEYAMHTKLKGVKGVAMSVQSHGRHNATKSKSAVSDLPQAVTQALARLVPRTEQVLTRSRSGAITKGHGRRHTRRMRKTSRRGRRGTRRR